MNPADREDDTPAQPRRLQEAEQPFPVRRVLLLSVAAAVASFSAYLALSPSPGTPPPEPIGTISLFSAPLQLSERGEREWTTLAPIGTRLHAGTELRTTPSLKLEVQLLQGSLVRLNGSTHVTLDTNAFVRLHEGELWCRGAERLPPAPDPPSLIRVWTPHAVLTLRGKAAAMDVSVAQDRTAVSVLSGELVIRAPGKGEQRASGGEQVEADAREIQAPVPSPPRASRWMIELLARSEETTMEHELLAEQLVGELGENETAEGAERELRLLGRHAASALVALLRDSSRARDAAHRHRAARLLAGSARGEHLPDLLELAADADPEVRDPIAKAYARLYRAMREQEAD